LPQWGGIVIHNPLDQIINLTDDSLLPILQLFVSQLRELLGITPIDNTTVPSKKNGIAEWEMDSLTRRYTFYNVNSTIATLKSLSKLVQNLKNMVVLDNIEALCSTSLNSLEMTRQSLLSANYQEAFISSRQASKSAEEAFFDPNMLALLYFPDDHKYAIYALPFVPITFQLLSGIYSELKIRKQMLSKKIKSD